MLCLGGGGWIRTSVRISGQIYSLLPLTTRPPLRGKPATVAQLCQISSNFRKLFQAFFRRLALSHCTPAAGQCLGVVLKRNRRKTLQNHLTRISGAHDYSSFRGDTSSHLLLDAVRNRQARPETTDKASPKTPFSPPRINNTNRLPRQLTHPRSHRRRAAPHPAARQRSQQCHSRENTPLKVVAKWIY